MDKLGMHKVGIVCILLRAEARLPALLWAPFWNIASSCQLYYTLGVFTLYGPLFYLSGALSRSLFSQLHLALLVLPLSLLVSFTDEIGSLFRYSYVLITASCVLYYGLVIGVGLIWISSFTRACFAFSSLRFPFSFG